MSTYQPEDTAALQRLPARRARWTRPVRAAASAALLPAALLAMWHLAARFELVPPQILPQPKLVGATLRELAGTGELASHFVVSLTRIALGFVAGAAAGLLLGLAMGLSRRIEDYLRPLFEAVSQVPVLGWVPLLMMLVGIGEALKVIIIAKAALIPVATNALKGVRNVPASYVEVARVFRFGQLQLLRKVVLPAAFPGVFVGLRFGLTQAWLALVTVELLASSEGLGFLIVWGRQLFQLDVVLAAIVVVGAIGLVLDFGLARLERRLVGARRGAF